MQHDVAALLDGALAGSGATAAMSAVMITARKAGILGRQPPEIITEKALGTIGIQHKKKTQDVLAVVLHFGFGGATGALFGLLHHRLRLPSGAETQGVVFGSFVWAVSYKGWVPALGIMPPPGHDRPGRPLVMLLAHWVYGWTLGRSLNAAGGVRRMVVQESNATH